MYITNDVEVSKIAEENGVDRIFVDLEYLGKEERQHNMDTVKSKHTLMDVAAIRKVLNKSELFVRVNKMNENSAEEINGAIENGADIIMLPYFKTIEEVRLFISYISGRVRSCLLIETPEAVEILDDILALDGIDEMYIGLNDLHLGYKRKFMFELLADGTVDKISEKIKQKGIPFGFGGISYIGGGLLPAERIITEHYRIGSSTVILSRSFCNTSDKTIKSISDIFTTEVKNIRKFEDSLTNLSDAEIADNRTKIAEIVEKIVNKKGENDV